jgi:hypothetical protein
VDEKLLRTQNKVSLFYTGRLGKYIPAHNIAVSYFRVDAAPIFDNDASISLVIAISSVPA